MTRPQIIRADTLDLQDKTSPTAQDHSRQPQHPAPLGIGPAAPHQEATLRQVTEQRNSEEISLQNGTWNDGASTLREDSGSDDERTLVNRVNGTGNQNLQQDEQAVRLNGGSGGDEGEVQDGDVEEDLEDDMMDKISSSPSIDDGGYSLPSTPQHWPARTSFMSPTSPAIRSPAISYSTQVGSSSPFTTTPIHLPIPAAAAREPSGVPAGGSEHSFTSYYRSSPIPFPTTHLSEQGKFQSAEHHHGEYGWSSQAEPPTLKIGNGPDKVSPRTQRRLVVEGRLQTMREDSQASLFSDVDEEAIRNMLRAVPSPRGSTIHGPLDDAEDVPGLLEEEADDDWTTDSDTDSWDEEADDDDDDDSNDVFFSDDPRFIDFGWGGECLRETEDIDFEFVYALHTFVATVEGQANATKGDTMVLLDDSNSYWWLVRVVKDSSIGYLPAEHIETPTERLARLNKHRNIDLSATMLGDTAEKTKNPLRKAIRRRNAKTVQFAPPTYVEASDYDYSSDEGGEEELFGGADPTQAQSQVTDEKEDTEQDDGLKVQPLKVNGAKKEQDHASEDAEPVSVDDAAKANSDDGKPSEELVERPLDPKVSRNGTLRNTDSFFKDDNAETRKITLTPNLLRDDSSTSTTGSRERGPSLESLEKNGFADKVKDEKKRKEKKPGMLSGLFKRKEKKSKAPGTLDSFDSDVEKQSEEFGRSSPQSKDSLEVSSDRTSTDQNPAQAPQRQTSKGKLQKQQRNRDDSPSKVSKGVSKTDSPEPTSVQSVAPKGASDEKSAGLQAASTMRSVPPEQEEMEQTAVEQRVQPSEDQSRASSAASKLNPMNMLRSQQTDTEPRPEKVKQAKQRVQLDDFDSEEDDMNDPFADPQSTQETAAGASDSVPTGRLSESPVQISAADAQSPVKELAHGKSHEPDAQPPDLAADTSSQETPSPVSTPSPEDSPSTTAPTKPSLAAAQPAEAPSPTSIVPLSTIPPPTRPAPIPTKEMETSPPVSSESASLPAWSDSSLRTYLDDGSDVRDMLLVINDTTGIVPVGPEHPIMSQLFVEETKAVTQLGGQLDSLLNNWLESKRRKQKGVASPKVMR